MSMSNRPNQGLQSVINKENDVLVNPADEISKLEELLKKKLNAQKALIDLLKSNADSKEDLLKRFDGLTNGLNNLNSSNVELLSKRNVIVNIKKQLIAGVLNEDLASKFSAFLRNYQTSNETDKITPDTVKGEISIIKNKLGQILLAQQGQVNTPSNFHQPARVPQAPRSQALRVDTPDQIPGRPRNP